MTLTTIEKAAKLMGLNYTMQGDTVLVPFSVGYRPFNPYTNKADLVDVECALGVDVEWHDATESIEGFVVARKKNSGKNFREYAWLDDHPDKFTARAHAVMAVVEQIYDKQFGGE